MHPCVAGDELQRHLATQLALLGRACDYVCLSAARLQATQVNLQVMMLQVQRMVFESGRWHGAAGFAHAVGAAALVQTRHLKTMPSAAEARLKMIRWLWEGQDDALRFGPAQAFLGLRGWMSYGSEMKAVVSPFAAACTAVTQLAMSLMTEECTLDEYIESLTMYASNACTEVLSDIEHQLERTLHGPYEKVAKKVARLTEESDPSSPREADAVTSLSEADEVIRTALGLLQEASPALATAKVGLEKLGRFLDKVCHCTSLSRPMWHLINWVARATTRLASLHAPLPMPECRFCGMRH